MTRKEMKIMKYVKSLVLLATLSALPKIATADVMLVFDSGWIAGGEYKQISTSGMTGQLTGLVFNLEFDNTGDTYAGDGGVCFIQLPNPEYTYGSYDLHCSPSIGDFPASWDSPTPGPFSHTEYFPATVATLTHADLLWVNGWSSSPLARWHGTVVARGC